MGQILFGKFVSFLPTEIQAQIIASAPLVSFTHQRIVFCLKFSFGEILPSKQDVSKEMFCRKVEFRKEFKTSSREMGSLLFTSLFL